ncbi:hypothetical protein CFN78_17900 [Amycolatopsis antarctica]|uniref:Uncharacterized protein n=1 Tax=Amycolatopsis antarctica TaxID=1854586 RepID=A0A263D1P3_9PSEU|nr:DUF6506 family protein [Amycolatopsis antarctica]OZM72008.1 hypothetical protein CFN78_17900 [Amycolatopsis antarctica]
MHAVDTMFVFLAAQADPAGHRVDRPGPAGGTAYVWVPDAAAAARVVAEQARVGAGLVELYRGFDLRAAEPVLRAADGRVPVGVSGWGPAGTTGPDAPRDSVMIVGAGERELELGPFTTDIGGLRTTVVPVGDEAGVERAAARAAADGADLIELCGGTELVTAARAQRAAGGVPVVLVGWPFESITGAAAYRAAFEARAN